MPASSRLTDLFGIGSTLRRPPIPLLAGTAEDDGWQAIWANAMFGGSLTAVADPGLGRVRLDLYWPGIRSATISRLHADGSTWEVRGGDPALVLTQWARYDYEAPLDQTVTYTAVSAERSGVTALSNQVSVTAGTRAWLTHPTKPALNRLVTLTTFGARQRPARRGILRPLEGKYPVPVHGVRQAPVGRVMLQTDGSDELAAVEALLDDGAQLMLRLPAIWGGHAWYISVDTTADDRADPTIGDLIIENVELPFDVVGRETGEAQGDLGGSYADAGAAFETYGQMGNAAASYLDLSMMSF